MVIIVCPQRAGIWPNGEPQSVRDAADGNGRPHGYDVYMVVIGGYDTYEVAAVFEDRATAQLEAATYNAVYAPGCDNIECLARVEEVSFYPAGVLTQPFFF